MKLLLHNRRNGRLEDLALSSPPRCLYCWVYGGDDGSLTGFRRDAFRSCLLAALSYLGIEPVESEGGRVDLACGPSVRQVAGARLTLAEDREPAPTVAQITGKGFDPLDLRLYCLRVHYRRPLAFDWESLEAARAERQGLSEAAGRLRERAGACAPNPTGLAGYRKRFRDALSADLDFPKAIGALWDALRPGALSPGSQWAALDEAERVLGLLHLG